MKRSLPARKKASHKGDYGKVLIVAGSRGMLGAGVLATRAALRTGSGLVYWAVPDDLVNYANTITPEVIVVSLRDVNKVTPDAVAIGPGIDQKLDVNEIIQQFTLPPAAIVIDATALPQLKAFAGRAIITPHPGEMAALLGLTVEAVQANRRGIALQAALKFGAVVVLKGHQTVIAEPEGKVVINKSGNPGMATAGAGDVLTGMIASLAGQGLPAWNAAVTGVNLHGRAGDLAARRIGEPALIASDIIEQIGYAIQKSH
ncbi:MAG: NAD(P)H-hydrate dehydratase [Candidatus Margulisbacteria bacterium]|jgi:NAD(P)H-hydrate epimerase|nr:NAD(P)H-hydrate dehydratase [Candidatus Margulisiibacteriota bacterium]